MKRLLYILFVTTMIMSCSDNNEFYDEKDRQEPIVFESPVIGSNTRAALTSAIYPEDSRFKVYAFRHTGEYTSGWNNNYIDGEEVFVHEFNTTGKKYWAPGKQYFWPKNGDFLSFAAYSPSDVPAVCATDGITVTDYILSDVLAEQKDLMYSGRILNKKSGDMWDIDNPTGNPDYYGLGISFKHALSLITFTVKSDFPNLVLKEIVINNACDKGTFKENITDNAASKASPAWSAQGFKPSSTKTFNVFNGSQNITSITTGVPSTESPVSMLMIPQNLIDTSDAQTLTIRWTYMNGGPDGKVENDEITINLYDLGKITKWDVGKKYTYNIIINLDKIYFNPTVSDWTEENPQDVTI